MIVLRTVLRTICTQRYIAFIHYFSIHVIFFLSFLCESSVDYFSVALCEPSSPLWHSLFRLCGTLTPLWTSIFSAWTQDIHLESLGLVYAVHRATTQRDRPPAHPRPHYAVFTA